IKKIVCQPRRGALAEPPLRPFPPLPHEPREAERRGGKILKGMELQKQAQHRGPVAHKHGSVCEKPQTESLKSLGLTPADSRRRFFLKLLEALPCLAKLSLDLKLYRVQG